MTVKKRLQERHVFKNKIKLNKQTRPNLTSHLKKKKKRERFKLHFNQLQYMDFI